MDTYPHSLPVQLTSFVGRDAELLASLEISPEGAAKAARLFGAAEGLR